MTVWLVPYVDSWSYGFNARGVADALRDRLDVRVARKPRDVQAGPDDVVVDFWWNGEITGPRVVRQVSSHRWTQGRYGHLTAQILEARRLRDVAAVIVPSVRLERELSAVCSVPVLRTPKGFDPKLFADRGERAGECVIGWAGAAQADKGIEMLRRAVPDLQMSIKGSRPHHEMAGFYNAIDVITVGSLAEGDPLTLIEGMACGCFPVAVDVGIVPELVRHGDNGLIVERTSEAFAEALAWCRANVDHVRAAGRRNAEEMRATRTWAHVAPAWGDAFEVAANRPAR